MKAGSVELVGVRPLARNGQLPPLTPQIHKTFSGGQITWVCQLSIMPLNNAGLRVYGTLFSVFFLNYFFYHCHH